MHLNYLALAIPLFLVLMGAEYLYARKKGKRFFRFPDSIANINVGIAERLFDTFTVGIFYFVYDYLHRHYAIFEIRSSVLLWITLLIFTDFLWYWYHRLAHEVSIFWCAHVVHHQSEEFNYTVSARITVFQAFVRVGFWAVLPVIGFPPAMITSVLLVHGLYPFFIHTRTIGKLGWLEYILVTPSHHRVHHASNPQYLDRNYGDLLIIWDKLFGTFTAEDEEPVYGLTTPLNSHSFLWQHFHFFLEMIYAVRHADNWRQRLKIIFGKPDYVPAEARDRLEARFLLRNEYTTGTDKLKSYVVWQTGVILTLLFLFLLLEYYVPVVTQVCITLVVLLTLINCGAILEQKRWVFYLEYARLLVLVIGLLYWWPHPVLWWSASLLMLAAFYYHTHLKQYYLRLVYGRSH